MAAAHRPTAAAGERVTNVTHKKMATTALDAIKAIKDTNGFISQAAKRLGISRVQLYRIVNSHPTVKEALDDAREDMKDFAEAQLFKNIKEGKEASVFFFLKTQAKDRGYVEKIEIEHLLKKELDAMLDVLQRELDDDAFSRILTILSDGH